MSLKVRLIIAGGFLLVLAFFAVTCAGTIWFLKTKPPAKEKVVSLDPPGWKRTDPDDHKAQELCIQPRLTLLAAGKFDELEQEAAQAGATNAGLPTGWPPLDLFYETFRYSEWSEDKDWDVFLQNLRSWQSRRPASATARLALATASLDYAENYESDDWRPYNRRVRQAALALQEAAKLGGDKNPIYWQKMLWVARAQGWNQARFQTLSQEALKRFPHDPVLYYLTCVYLLPEWYGEEGQWESWLALHAPEMGPGAEGDMVYARLTSALYDYLHDDSGRFFIRKKISWPRARAGLIALCDKYPTSVYWKTVRLHLAYHASDKEDARLVIAAMKGRYDAGVINKSHMIEILKWANE